MARLSGATCALSLALTTAPLAAQHPGQQDDPRAPMYVAQASDEGREQLATMQLADGLVADLVAAEPDVCNGVAFAIDGKGRFWVCETFRIGDGVFDTRSYMQWKDRDLACLTVADREAKYREFLPDRLDDLARRSERVRMLVDTNGDGTLDRSTVFADGFAALADGIVSGVLPVGDDVWVTNIPKLWRLRDTDGDGVADEAVSLITLYSQQGGGGGAHDEDYLGYIVVHGDKVEEDDIETDAMVAYGIVETIDDIQEAVAPTGETKWIDLDGDGTAEHLGYDTRDVAGDPVGSSPWDYSSNHWLNTGQVDLASAIPAGLSAPGVLLSNAGGAFGGQNQPMEIPHDPSQAVSEGTWAFSFTADNPGNGQNQALFSKDHSGFGDGGHLTAYITDKGVLKLRFQSENDEKYLVDWSVKVQAGQEHHFAFTFDEDEIGMYLDGNLIDADTGFAGGMSGNAEDLVLGASTRTRMGDQDNLQWHFDGQISNFLLLDRPLEEIELLFLAEAGGDIDALESLYSTSAGVNDSQDGESGETETPGTGETETPGIGGTETPGTDDTDGTGDADGSDGMDGTDGTEEPATDDDGETASPSAGDDDGFAGIFSKIINILLSIFGLGSNGGSVSTEVIEDKLTEVETLLNDLIPATEPEADQVDMTQDVEDEQPELEML